MASTLAAAARPRKGDSVFEPKPEKPKRAERPPKLQLRNLLPVVNREPRTGQITAILYPSLDAVDSTRVDEQYRLTREQVGTPTPLGIRRGRYVTTIAPEIQYRGDRAPGLQFRLDAWVVSRVQGGHSWKRRTYMRLSLSGVRDLINLFGGATGKAVGPTIALAVDALKEARHGYHMRRNEAIAEAEAALRAAAPPRSPEPEGPRAVDMFDLETLI